MTENFKKHRKNYEEAASDSEIIGDSILLASLYIL